MRLAKDKPSAGIYFFALLIKDIRGRPGTEAGAEIVAHVFQVFAGERAGSPARDGVRENSGGETLDPHGGARKRPESGARKPTQAHPRPD